MSTKRLQKQQKKRAKVDSLFERTPARLAFEAARGEKYPLTGIFWEEFDEQWINTNYWLWFRLGWEARKISKNEELRQLFLESCVVRDGDQLISWLVGPAEFQHKLENLPARHSEPAAAVRETDRERARKWLRQFRYDDMQTDSLAAEFAANRSEHSAAVKEADEIVEACAMAVDTAYRRNMSGENWHSRAMNCVRALKGTFALKGEEEPR